MYIYVLSFFFKMHLLLHPTYLSPVDSWTTGGSIQYAECSESSDAEKILSEIGPDCAEVDFAIHVLLTAGMSTTALRDIARAGVDIHNAAYSEITAAVTILGPFDLLTFSHLIFELFYESGELIVSVLQFLSILFRIIIMIVLCRSEIDDIYFVLKVLTKAVGLLLMLLLLVCFIAISTKRSPLLAWLILLDLVLGFAVILCILGIKNTAQMPFGLQILQVFFARGTTVFSACKKEPVQAFSGWVFKFYAISWQVPRTFLAVFLDGMGLFWDDIH